MRTVLVLCATCLSLAGLASAQGVGGSNYAWYEVDPNCTREPYGIIANYNVVSPVNVSATVASQLHQMVANGQQRLRIPIYFGHGLNTGTVMDSTGGNLSAQNRANLTAFLSAVKSAGIIELEVGFFPQGPNDPTSWSAYSETYYQENWNLIYNLHPIIAGSGLAYRIDLQNEGLPLSSQTALLQYDQHLWNNYVYTFGKNDTLGVSFIADPNRLQNVDLVYGNSQYGNHGTPYLFDLHIYDETTATFLSAFNALHSYAGTGWIIGEVYYNDAAEAASLRQAISSTRQTVFYVAQWPLQKGSSCASTGVTTVPLLYNYYKAQGF